MTESCPCGLQSPFAATAESHRGVRAAEVRPASVPRQADRHRSLLRPAGLTRRERRPGFLPGPATSIRAATRCRHAVATARTSSASRIRPSPQQSCRNEAVGDNGSEPGWTFTLSVHQTRASKGSSMLASFGPSKRTDAVSTLVVGKSRRFQAVPRVVNSMGRLILMLS